MWKEGKKILFVMKVKETDKFCITGGGAELLGQAAEKL